MVNIALELFPHVKETDVVVMLLASNLVGLSGLLIFSKTTSLLLILSVLLVVDAEDF